MFLGYNTKSINKKKQINRASNLKAFVMQIMPGKQNDNPQNKKKFSNSILIRDLYPENKELTTQ